MAEEWVLREELGVWNPMRGLFVLVGSREMDLRREGKEMERGHGGWKITFLNFQRKLTFLKAQRKFECPSTKPMGT